MQIKIPSGCPKGIFKALFEAVSHARNIGADNNTFLVLMPVLIHNNY